MEKTIFSPSSLYIFTVHTFTQRDCKRIWTFSEPLCEKRSYVHEQVNKSRISVCVCVGTPTSPKNHYCKAHPPPIPLWINVILIVLHTLPYTPHPTTVIPQAEWVCVWLSSLFPPGDFLWMILLLLFLALPGANYFWIFSPVCLETFLAELFLLRPYKELAKKLILNYFFVLPACFFVRN